MPKSRVHAAVRSRYALRGRVLVGLMVAGLVLAGCQSNPEPPPLESTSTSASPSPSESPTESAPTLPAEAKGTSEAAAKAFVRHWIDVLNYAGPAGEPDLVRELSSPTCAACGGIVAFIEDVTKAGGRIEGRGWSVRSLKVVSGKSGKRAVVDVRTLVHPQKVQSSATSDVQNFPGGRRLKTFWLTTNGSAWTVTRLDQPQ